MFKLCLPLDFGQEDDPFTNEEKVRDLIRRKLRITREIPFNRYREIPKTILFSPPKKPVFGF